MLAKGVIFTNPLTKTREGQQKRGMFPLPLIALADFLDREIKIKHASPDFLIDHSLVTTVASESNFEWLAITCYQETMESVVELARIAKENNQKVILGGHHITLWGGKKVLEEIPEVDFAIIGEGEIPLKLLIANNNQQEISGLWWREHGTPKTNMLPLHCNNWSDRPPMIKGYSAFDYTALWDRNGKIGRTGYKKPFSVIGIRGCAYAQRTRKRCVFCAMPLNSSLQCRNPAFFWEEISWAVKQLHIDLIWEHSDSFLGVPAWLTEVAEIRPRNTPPIWCYGRADEINAVTIGSISKIGIEHIYIGVEVGSDKRLREIKKGITLAQVLNAIRLCRKYNIRVQPSFIIGLPGETKKSLDDTINFALLCKEEGADDIVFHEFILRKGLQWFEMLVRRYPALNRVVLNQCLVQNFMWQYFNPNFEREEAMTKIKETIGEFSHSELTAWNI